MHVAANAPPSLGSGMVSARAASGAPSEAAASDRMLRREAWPASDEGSCSADTVGSSRRRRRTIVRVGVDEAQTKEIKGGLG